ncbi:MAG: hypothetical protein JSR67_09450 [Proteobacteria bacterium]|nr:hypothetical protein [Pseudomonadota bacterium]
MERQPAANPATADSAAHAVRLMPRMLLLYTAASLLHFWHNAQHLAQYPNLPATWTPAEVWLAWCAVTGVGALGYLLYRAGRRIAGLTILAIYGVAGLGGLLHYTRAPMALHGAGMNLTIWTEVAAAAAFLGCLAAIAISGTQGARSNSISQE